MNENGGINEFTAIINTRVEDIMNAFSRKAACHDIFYFFVKNYGGCTTKREIARTVGAAYMSASHTAKTWIPGKNDNEFKNYLTILLTSLLNSNRPR